MNSSFHVTFEELLCELFSYPKMLGNHFRAKNCKNISSENLRDCFSLHFSDCKSLRWCFSKKSVAFCNALSKNLRPGQLSRTDISLKFLVGWPWTIPELTPSAIFHVQEEKVSLCSSVRRSFYSSYKTTWNWPISFMKSPVFPGVQGSQKPNLPHFPHLKGKMIV